jgi:hypothetical protein
MDSKLLMKTYKLCLPMGNTIKGTSKNHRSNTESTNALTQMSMMVNGRMKSVLAVDAFSQLVGGKLKVMFI